MGDPMPSSYLVQERVDPAIRAYLESLDVRVVEPFCWNALAGLLHAINLAIDPT